MLEKSAAIQVMNKTGDSGLKIYEIQIVDKYNYIVINDHRKPPLKSSSTYTRNINKELKEAIGKLTHLDKEHLYVNIYYHSDLTSPAICPALTLTSKADPKALNQTKFALHGMSDHKSAYCTMLDK